MFEIPPPTAGIGSGKFDWAKQMLLVFYFVAKKYTKIIGLILKCS